MILFMPRKVAIKPIVEKHMNKVVNIRNMKKFNVDSFTNDLNNLPWSNLDCLLNVNERWDLWKKIFMTVVDKHAPLLYFF